MQGWLIDTNVLLRLQEDDPDCSEVATDAVAFLLDSRARVCITPQVIVELWCAATRPLDVNGLGWSRETASARVADCLDRFEMLDECPEVFTNWRMLVERYDRKGKQVHDARLVAVMKAHGVENLLTFNTDDFKSYDGISARHPADVA